MLCRSALQASRRLLATPPTRQLCAAAAETTSGDILGFAKSQPWKTNIIIATLKTAACDYLVQRYIEKREEIPWKRNAVFAVFGCFYLGGVQWFIYVDVMKKLFPGMAAFGAKSLREKLRDPAGMRALLGQVAFDNFVHYPLIYFPVFYVFKETIQGAGADVSSIASSGLSKYQTNAVEDNLSMWALWVPGDLIVYAVPLWMRLPLNHGLSFIWTCYLSFLRGDEIKTDGDGPGGAAPPAIKNRGAGKLPWTFSGADSTLALDRVADGKEHHTLVVESVRSALATSRPPRCVSFVYFRFFL